MRYAFAPFVLRSIVLLLAVAGAAGCKSAEPVAEGNAGRALDRLGKNELPVGTEAVFELPLPKDMQVQYRFRSGTHAVGKIPQTELAEYVRERVHADRIEVSEKRTLFSNARVKGGDPKRRYEIEIVPVRLATKLIISEKTPTPPQPAP